MSVIVLPKFLIGKDLSLRPRDKEADLERCCRWVNDPEIRQFLKVRTPFTRSMEAAWFDRDSPNDIQLAIVLNDGDRHIGNMGLYRIDWIHRHAVTGSLIGEKDCWGKGYGTEAKMLLLDYAFRWLNLRRISTSVIATNIRSLRCQLKCGYREEGRRRERFFIDDMWVDEVVLGVLRDEWIAQFPKQ